MKPNIKSVTRKKNVLHVILSSITAAKGLQAELSTPLPIPPESIFPPEERVHTASTMSPPEPPVLGPTCNIAEHSLTGVKHVIELERFKRELDNIDDEIKLLERQAVNLQERLNERHEQRRQVKLACSYHCEALAGPAQRLKSELNNYA